MNILSQEFELNSNLKKNLTFSSTTLNKSSHRNQDDKYSFSHNNAPYPKKNQTERINKVEESKRPPLSGLNNKNSYAESKSHKNISNVGKNLDYNQRRQTNENNRNHSRSKTKSLKHVDHLDYENNTSISPARTTKTVKKIPFTQNGYMNAMKRQELQRNNSIEKMKERGQEREALEQAKKKEYERNVAMEQYNILNNYKKGKASETYEKTDDEEQRVWDNTLKMQAPERVKKSKQAHPENDGFKVKKGMWQWGMIKKYFSSWAYYVGEIKLQNKKEIFAREICHLSYKRKLFEFLLQNCSKEKYEKNLERKCLIFERLRLVSKSFFILKKLHIYRSKIKSFVIKRLTKQKCMSKILIMNLLKENKKINTLKEISWKKALIFRSKKLINDAFTNWEYAKEYVKRLRYLQQFINMQKASTLKQKSFLIMKQYSDDKISLKERVVQFKERVDYRRKIVGLAQIKENTTISVFDNNLKTRVEMFNKYYCAKEFFRRAQVYRTKVRQWKEKRILADEQFRARNLLKYFSILKETSGRLGYIEDQLISIYEQSLCGRAYESLKNYLIDKTDKIPIFSPYQVF